MSIYGDSEGGESELSSVTKAPAGPQLAVCQNLTDDQKKQIGAGVGVVFVLWLLYWLFSSGGAPTCTDEEAAAVAARRMPITTDADGTVHFQADGQLQKREHDAVTLPTDYQVKFTIIPGPTVNPDWSNIIHFSATGDNCCNYGDRVPGVWFYPGKRQLHIIDGHGQVGAGNDECVIEEELVPGTRYNVQVDAHEKFVEVYINNVMKCTEPRKDRRPFPTAKVYASDPWYAPADAVLSGLQLSPLEPLSGCTYKGACNYDISASTNAGCIEAQGGFCGVGGGGYQVVGPELTQPITLISTPRRLARHPPLVHEARASGGGLQGYGGGGYQQASNGAIHAVVPIPMDYQIEFAITPDFGVVETWANIVHFTATMTNCCEYGDRIPGIWFHPGTHKLHIRDGMDADGNSGCDPDDELIPGQESQIKIQIGSNGVDVQVGEVVVCSRTANARRPWSHVHVFAADPWHEPALATISTLILSPLAPKPGCMIDAACNRDFTATHHQASLCQWPDHDTSDCTGRHAMTVTPRSNADEFGHPGVPYSMTLGPQSPALATPIQQFSATNTFNSGGGAHAVLNIPLDYRFTFKITPTGIHPEWSNIFHITATGQNCCNYGDRVPGVWFFPGETRLHVVHGHRDSGNDDCSPEEPLPMNVETEVTIDIRQKHVSVMFNGRVVCTEPRGTVETFNAAHLFLSDVWHAPAPAEMRDWKLEHMTPVLGCTQEASCNYDATAAFDDDSCIALSPGMECGLSGCPPPPPPGYQTYGPPPPLFCQQQAISAPGGGAQFLLPPLRPISQRGAHAMVNLPLDYTVSFDLQPNYVNAINEVWSNIIHFTATGSNCCEYGDRVPAVWFYPGSLRLHIIDGQPSNGNDECVIQDELQPGRTYHIEIKVSERGVDVSFDGVHKCHENKSDRQALQNVHVFASDPWHPPAGAQIGDLKMTVP